MTNLLTLLVHVHFGIFVGTSSLIVHDDRGAREDACVEVRRFLRQRLLRPPTGVLGRQQRREETAEKAFPGRHQNVTPGRLLVQLFKKKQWHSFINGKRSQ